MSASHKPVSARVAIIVPVHNRGDQLARLLASVGRLDFPVAEFIVVVCDDGSTEDLRSVVEQARRQYGLSIQHLHQEQRGPAAARNLGLQSVDTEFVAFTDSDCEVAPGWLRALLETFDNPDVGIAGGPVVPHGDSPLVAQCSNWIMSTMWGGGARDPRSLASMGYYPRAGNMAVRTALARRSGGFPNTRYGEDVGFSHRLLETGVKAAFAAGAEVKHNERRTLSQLFVEAFKKGGARARLWRSQKAIEFIHTIPAVLVAYLFFAPLAAYSVPRFAALVALPAIAYLLLLLAAACHAVFSLRTATALCVAPCAVFMLHFGYGMGLIRSLCYARQSATGLGPVSHVAAEVLVTEASATHRTTNQKTVA